MFEGIFGLVLLLLRRLLFLLLDTLLWDVLAERANLWMLDLEMLVEGAFWAIESLAALDLASVFLFDLFWGSSWPAIFALFALLLFLLFSLLWGGALLF